MFQSQPQVILQRSSDRNRLKLIKNRQENQRHVVEVLDMKCQGYGILFSSKQCNHKQPRQMGELSIYSVIEVSKMLGIGKAKGDDKAVEAVKMAVTSPLLETTIEGASHVIINVSGDIGLMEANEAASYVEEMAGSEANIIFGAMYDDSRQDEATITIIATGLDSQPSAREAQKTQQSIKPTTNYNYKPQTNTTQFRTQMGMGNDMGIQQSKPSINFDVPPRPARSVTEKDIQIPTFLQKNRNK